MFLLISFAFFAGIVTVLSPCILPLLPFILSSADGSSKQKPVGVVVGFVTSFTFFTLFLSTIVRISGIPAESLRFFSIFILVAFGISILIPQVQLHLEKLFSNFANRTPSVENKNGFFGGVMIGFSLGLLWSPCVGPILASVISLAITGTVTTEAFIITLAYALGTAIPMFLIMFAGSKALQRVPWLLRNTGTIQKVFGVLMILTGIAIFFNIDRRFQTWVLTTFPNYGVGLTKFEDTPQIKNELNKVSTIALDEVQVGEPMLEQTRRKSNPAPELMQGGKWFNSTPLQLKDLKGKVILVDFWTYSCINCQRTIPYLTKWWKTYEDEGLVIIGVHSPEFEFEKNPENVQQAIADFGITYPIMQDNEFSTWLAYGNRYWPAKYLIDKDGYIRYTHFGEGKYDETEKVIQELLKETGTQLSTVQILNQQYQTFGRTPELYLGYARLEYLASPEQVKMNQISSYTAPITLPNNTFAYKGDWSLMSEFAAPTMGAELLLSFEAKEVFLVARPKNGESGKIKVYLDDQLQAFGADNNQGVVTVDSDTLYKLIRLSNPGRHLLNLEFLDNNLEIYAFTFG